MSISHVSTDYTGGIRAMDEITVIEYPSAGATYSRDEYGVYRYSEYPESSVLAGQERRQFLDSFPTLDEARAAFPDAEWSGEAGTGYREITIPREPPAWFDPAMAGEAWGEDDY
jgi:hypothetical protein